LCYNIFINTTEVNMPNEKTIPARSDQDSASCWRVTDLFESDDAWEAELDACQALPEKLAAYAGRLGQSGGTLYEYLAEMESIDERVEKLIVYAFIRNDEDTANPTYQAMKGRSFSFAVKLSSAQAFAGPEIVAIAEEDLQRFYRETPELAKYRRYLDKARLEGTTFCLRVRRTCSPPPPR
jgi:oligoendopeptidase F